MSEDVKEFTPEGGNRQWRVGDFPSLAAAFGIFDSDLPKFHLMLSNHPAWFIAREHYCIAPIEVSLKTDSEHLRPRTLAEIASGHSMDEDDVATNLGSLIHEWEKLSQNAIAEEEKDVSGEVMIPAAPESVSLSDWDFAVEVELRSDEIKLIAAHGFPRKMFELKDRDEVEAKAEMKWFATRIMEMRHLFADPMAKDLARSALLTYLQIRRHDSEIACLSPTEKKLPALQNSKDSLERRYQELWNQIEKMCPYAKSFQQKTTFNGTMSEIIEAVKVFKATGNTEMLDGLHTAFEIQVQFRNSVQSPEPRTRLGWLIAVNEAKRCIWDPQYKRQIPDYICRVYDEAFRIAEEKLRVEHGRELPDLEKEGGEYPPLFTPTHTSEPSEKVEISGK